MLEYVVIITPLCSDWI